MKKDANNSRQEKERVGLALSLVLLLSMMGTPALARDASFLDPNSASGGEEAVKVDPKAEVDVGETPLNVAKRTSLFFVNETNLPIKIETVAVNGDSNVVAEASANDCIKQGAIAPSSRCSVEVSATPTSPGSWNVEVLMTHNGAGRLTRAHITGKTSGSGSADSKTTGLAVNSKEIKPVDFGDVIVGDGKVVRSTLMVNESSEPITIFAIDVIEADNGLQRLDQGCSVDMELAPGASCPITLLWVPQSNGPVSTDLIVRHSGKLGFAVIPIRGMAKGGSSSAGEGKGGRSADGSKRDIVPLPPSAQDLEKEMSGRVVPVSDNSLGRRNVASASDGDNEAHLIGTIGDRAIILKPDGETAIVPTGGTVDLGGKNARVTLVGSHSVDMTVEGKKKTLLLEAASSLVAKAAQQAQADAAATAPKTATAATASTVNVGGAK